MSTKTAQTATATTQKPRLYEGADWDFETLRRINEACEGNRHRRAGARTSIPTRSKVITAEQMLDAYSSIGMPLFYKHWSFGKHFATHEASYRKGMRGLAYEIVINSNPCISLCDGGEHDDDAGACHRPCGLRA